MQKDFLAPKIQSFILADSVSRDETTGKHDIRGVLTSISTPSFPLQYESDIYVYVSMTNIRQDTTIEIGMKCNEHEFCDAARELGRIVVGPSGDTTALAQTFFPIPEDSRRFPHQGIYLVTLTINDEEISSCRLVVYKKK